jgi:quinoprotein glucose dehydrogenase
MGIFSRFGEQTARTLLRASIIASLAATSSVLADEWSSYGRDAGGTRYSPLTDLTPDNVARLQVAWSFHTGDISDGSGNIRRSGFETTPLLIDGRLYLTTPFNRVIALDPTNGAQLWAYDPKLDKTHPYGDGFVNRGLAAWRDARATDRACSLRLYEATLDARLIALDATNGEPCRDFGAGGIVDLSDVENYRAGVYHMTSPPVALDDVVIVGSSINDNDRADMPAGAVRGYDARTGKKLWTWEPLQRPANVAPDAWKTGAGNAWSVLTADARRDLVYVPTGSASPDYYGGLRPGDDRWANSVVALKPRTGELVWGFQLVHHDLWDYDTAAAPLLTSLSLNGQRRDVLIAGNKTGMLYVLDPSSGKPVLPVEERPVPKSTVPGETSSPTQPFPVSLPRLARQSLPPDEAWGPTEADRIACQRDLQAMSGTSMFSPPSLQGVAATPSPFGGINWNGFAWDAKHERVVVAVTNLPSKVQLISREDVAAGERGSFRGDFALQSGTAYAMVRDAMKSPSGLPCGPPPWGELISVDLAGGKIAWRVPLGGLEELSPGIGKSAAGSVVLGGGPIVTAGGLIFVGGTMDRRLRAFSAETGAELWSAELPASAHALPITYEVHGKQYVVIAAGGAAHLDEERLSDTLVAFTLPSNAAATSATTH